jgi:hypothetical protein
MKSALKPMSNSNPLQLALDAATLTADVACHGTIAKALPPQAREAACEAAFNLHMLRGDFDEKPQRPPVRQPRHPKKENAR